MNVFVADPTLDDVDIQYGREVKVMDRDLATVEALFGAVGIDAIALAEPIPLEVGSEPATGIR